MKSFINFIVHQLDEAAAKGPIAGVHQNTAGVLHELLVGKHLNGGKHMEEHPDVQGKSPQEAHDDLKKTVTPEQYKALDARAKSAAEDIKSKLAPHGSIHKISWTSKPGDLKRTTGIDASQKEDASDIVVTTKKGAKGKKIHHGISLKATLKKSGAAPLSNPGMAATYGGQKIVDEHKAKVKKAFPKLAELSNASSRKEYVRANPKVQTAVRKMNRDALSSVAQHTANHLSSIPTKDLADHLRKHVLHAHMTPMQLQGHNHMRHTTNGESTFTHHAEDPGTAFEHILNDHKNITVKHTGQAITFYHKGKSFARHNIKFDSQDDPLGSVKGSGVKT